MNNNEREKYRLLQKVHFSNWTNSAKIFSISYLLIPMLTKSIFEQKFRYFRLQELTSTLPREIVFDPLKWVSVLQLVEVQTNCRHNFDHLFICLFYASLWSSLPSSSHTSYLSPEPREFSCKFFLAGVNFYRFNAKNWQFTVYFAVITQKLAIFCVFCRNLRVFSV